MSDLWSSHPVPPAQLSQHAAERYAQLSAVAESRREHALEPARERRARKLVRQVLAKLA